MQKDRQSDTRQTEKLLRDSARTKSGGAQVRNPEAETVEDSCCSSQQHVEETQVWTTSSDVALKGKAAPLGTDGLLLKWHPAAALKSDG